MTRDDKRFFVILIAFLIVCILLAVQAKRVMGKPLPQNTSAATVQAAAVGDTLMRKGNSEHIKIAPNKILARIYAEDQWENDGQPKVKFENDTEKIKAKMKSVRFVPDAVTKKLKVNREVSNTGVKETWYVPDATITKLSWTVECDTTFTWDDTGKVFTFGNGLTTTVPIAWDAGKKPVGMEVAYAVGVLTYTIVGEGYKYPITIDPTTTVNTGETHRLYMSNATYLTARNATTADGISSPGFEVGQYYINPNYLVARTLLNFIVNVSGMVSCDACTLYVNGSTDNSTTDFNVDIFGANSVRPAVTTADVDQFNGWQASGAYTGTVLNDAWNSSSYAVGWNAIVLNSAGRDSVFAANGDTLWVIIISDEDVNASPPINQERIEFEDTTGNIPYLSITYTLPSTVLTRSITQYGKPTPFRTEAGITVLKQP